MNGPNKAGAAKPRVGKPRKLPPPSAVSDVPLKAGGTAAATTTVHVGEAKRRHVIVSRATSPSPVRAAAAPVSPSHGLPSRAKSPSPRPLRRGEEHPPPQLPPPPKEAVQKKTRVAAKKKREASKPGITSPEADRRRKVKRAATGTSLSVSSSASSTPRRPSPSPLSVKLGSSSPSPPRRGKESFKRTQTLPASGRRVEPAVASPTRTRSTTLTHSHEGGGVGGGGVRRGCDSPLESRLDVGLPIGIPSGLLPASEMPPREVLVDTQNRKLLLLRICDELEATMPAHLLCSDNFTDEGKAAVKSRKKGSKSGQDIDEDEIDRRPVTSRFIRRVLVLFYASRNEAEETRVFLENEMRQGRSVGEWPDAIQCMHASYLIIDSLVRIGHRRVLKVLFGTLFWHVLDVLEWPPQVYQQRIRLDHRQHVARLPAPDLSLTPPSQQEDVVRLHRVFYVQNSCLVRACDSVTYLALHEFVESEKLRLLRNVIDPSFQGFSPVREECFVAKWTAEWGRAAEQPQRRSKLLAHLLAVTTSAWEHDKMTVFLRKLGSMGVTEILIGAVCDRHTHPDVASAAGEVLAILSSDAAAQEETRNTFLGWDHSMRVAGWKPLITATAGHGSRGVREMVHSILTQATDLWDVMTYLQAVESVVTDGLLHRTAEQVQNFCDSWNLILPPLGRVFRDAYAGKVAALVVSELSMWVKGRFNKDETPMVSSVLRTFTLLLRIPSAEVAVALKKLQVFENLVGFVPERAGLLQSSCLSLCRAVWWRTDSDDPTDVGTVHDPEGTVIGSYIENPQVDDPRAALIPPASYFLRKHNLTGLMANIMHGRNTLCATKHPQPGLRAFFERRTHYE